MYEPAPTCRIKSLFAVKIAVFQHQVYGYILLIINVITVIDEICDKIHFILYDWLSNVIIPNLGKEPEKRIFVAINKADAVMGGRNWDYINHHPLPSLEEFLDNRAKAVVSKIKAITGVSIELICYSAGYKYENEKQEASYNIDKLFYHIAKHLI